MLKLTTTITKREGLKARTADLVGLRRTNQAIPLPLRGAHKQKKVDLRVEFIEELIPEAENIWGLVQFWRRIFGC